MRVETAILVNHGDAGRFATHTGGARDIAAHLAIAVGRRILEVLLLDAFVLGLNNLRLEELRAQLIQEHQCRDSTNGVLRGFVQKGKASLAGPTYQEKVLLSTLVGFRVSLTSIQRCPDSRSPLVLLRFAPMDTPLFPPSARPHVG